MSSKPGPLRVAAAGVSLVLLVGYVVYRSGVAVSPGSEAGDPRVMPGSKAAPAADDSDLDLVMPGSKSAEIDLNAQPVDLEASQTERVVLPGSKSDRIIITDEPPAEP